MFPQTAIAQAFRAVLVVSVCSLLLNACGGVFGDHEGYVEKGEPKWSWMEHNNNAESWVGAPMEEVMNLWGQPHKIIDDNRGEAPGKIYVWRLEKELMTKDGYDCYLNPTLDKCHSKSSRDPDCDKQGHEYCFVPSVWGETFIAHCDISLKATEDAIVSSTKIEDYQVIIHSLGHPGNCAYMQPLPARPQKPSKVKAKK